MLDATSLMSRSPGLSAALLSKVCESYNPKGPENVNIITLNQCTGRLYRVATRYNDKSCDL